MEAQLEQSTPLWRRLQGTACFAWHVRGQARWPFRPLKAILAAQGRRVRKILRHAYRTVPYYRRTLDRLNLHPSDFRTAADLAQLPLISPAELRAEPEQFISEIYSPEACVRLFSSGSTGLERPCIRLKRFFRTPPTVNGSGRPSCLCWAAATATGKL